MTGPLPGKRKGMRIDASPQTGAFSDLDDDGRQQGQDGTQADLLQGERGHLEQALQKGDE
jgi:hypothetical protein